MISGGASTQEPSVKSHAKPILLKCCVKHFKQGKCTQCVVLCTALTQIRMQTVQKNMSHMVKKSKSQTTEEMSDNMSAPQALGLHIRQ